MLAADALCVPDVLERVLSFLVAAVPVPRDEQLQRHASLDAGSIEGVEQRSGAQSGPSFAFVTNAFFDPVVLEHLNRYAESHGGRTVEDYVANVRMSGYPSDRYEIRSPRADQASALALMSINKAVRCVASQLDFWRHRWYHAFGKGDLCRDELLRLSAREARTASGGEDGAVAVNWLYLFARCAAELFCVRGNDAVVDNATQTQSTQPPASSSSSAKGLLLGFLETIKRQVGAKMGKEDGHANLLVERHTSSTSPSKVVFVFSLSEGLFVVHDFLLMAVAAFTGVDPAAVLIQSKKFYVVDTSLTVLTAKIARKCSERGQRCPLYPGQCGCTVTLIGMELRRVRLRQLNELLSKNDVEGVWFLADAHTTLVPPTVVSSTGGEQRDGGKAQQFELRFPTKTLTQRDSSATSSPPPPATAIFDSAAFASSWSDELDELLYAIHKNPFLAPIFNSGERRCLVRPVVVLMGGDTQVPPGLLHSLAPNDERWTQIGLDAAHSLLQQLIDVSAPSKVNSTENGQQQAPTVPRVIVCGASLSFPSSLRRLLLDLL